MVQWHFCWQAGVREILGPSSGNVTAVANRLLKHLSGEFSPRGGGCSMDSHYLLLELCHEEHGICELWENLWSIRGAPTAY